MLSSKEQGVTAFNSKGCCVFTEIFPKKPHLQIDKIELALSTNARILRETKFCLAKVPPNVCLEKSFDDLPLYNFYPVSHTIEAQDNALVEISQYYHNTSIHHANTTVCFTNCRIDDVGAKYYLLVYNREGHDCVVYYNPNSIYVPPAKPVYKSEAAVNGDLKIGKSYFANDKFQTQGGYRLLPATFHYSVEFMFSDYQKLKGSFTDIKVL